MGNSRPSAVDELRGFGRYARRIPSFLGDTISTERACERIEHQLARRGESFLALLEHGVYGNPRSPYRALLDAAGIELGDVRGLIDDRSLEGALEVLRRAGVYVTLDEFKGRRPLARGSLSLDVAHSDFDNPLLAPQYWSRSSGARGPSRRVPLDLNVLEHDASHEAVFRSAFGLWDRRFALWRVKPPSTSGLNNALRQAKIGRSLERWFDPYRAPRDLEALKYRLFTSYTVRVGRLHGARLAPPEQCPAADGGRVARWIAASRREGHPVFMDAQAGLGVRACRAAVDDGIDISGTVFRLTGEPLTRAMSEIVEASRSRAVPGYSMVETGRIALACADPDRFDDMHFLSDKLAVLQRRIAVGSTGIEVNALLYTSLLPFTPRVMINVDSGDYATLTTRSCGCPWDELGLHQHMHAVRSYEKLTADGNHFLGSDLHSLIDEVLPGRFGGGPTDYQLVQEELRGAPRVSVVVRPSVGEVSNREVLATVIEFLRAEPRNRVMADFWAQSETLRVVRREPHCSATGKTPALHIDTPS
jgi:hypothetical protein